MVEGRRLSEIMNNNQFKLALPPRSANSGNLEVIGMQKLSSETRKRVDQARFTPKIRESC